MLVNNKKFLANSAGLRSARRWILKKTDIKNTVVINTFGSNKNDAERYCDYLNAKYPYQKWNLEERIEILNK